MDAREDMRRDRVALAQGRVVQVRVSLALLQALLTQGWGGYGSSDGATSDVRCIEGLPADACLVRAAVDEGTRELVLVVVHPSFARVPPGTPFPPFTPRYEQTVHAHEDGSDERSAPDESRVDRQRRAQKRRVESGGYQPVTPLGPPPTGEPLCARPDVTITGTDTQNARPEPGGDMSEAMVLGRDA